MSETKKILYLLKKNDRSQIILMSNFLVFYALFFLALYVCFFVYIHLSDHLFSLLLIIFGVAFIVFLNILSFNFCIDKKLFFSNIGKRDISDIIHYFYPYESILLAELGEGDFVYQLITDYKQNKSVCEDIFQFYSNEERFKSVENSQVIINRYLKRALESSKTSFIENQRRN